MSEYKEQMQIISELKTKFLSNRLECEDDFSRSLYDRAIGKIDLVLSDLCSILRAERALVALKIRDNVTQEQIEDAGEEVWAEEQRFCHRWYSKPIALLDEYILDQDTKEYWCPVGRDWRAQSDPNFPFCEEVPSSQLNGLDDLLSAFLEASGISVSIERVFYSGLEYGKYLENDTGQPSSPSPSL